MGKKLTIDPCSRAIAVASLQDKFDIFILRPTLSRSRFDPVVGRGSQIEEGIIWHMEFLHTESTSMDRILLALVIYNDVEKICRLVLYAINASNLQNVTMERIGRLPLESNTPLPLLLIPLQFRPESFLLVTEQQVCLLSSDDLACGNVLYPNSFIPRAFGSPLFNAATQHEDLDKSYVYLGSAEGCIYRLNITSSNEMNWTLIDSVNPIGQSMCLLGTVDLVNDNNTIRADVLLYAGECADSQVIAIPCPDVSQWETPAITVLQSLINRAPITDVEKISGYYGQQESLAVCSGIGKQGCLTFIARGVKARKVSSSQPEWKGINRLWSINPTASHLPEISCLMTSSPIDSRLIAAKDGQLQDIMLSTYGEALSETIHANTIYVKSVWLLLRVHFKGISILMVQGQNAPILTQHRTGDSEGNIEHATSWQDSHGTYVAICLLKEKGYVVQILSIEDDGINEDCTQIQLCIRPIKEIPIDDCPSFINCLQVKSSSWLVIGTYKPSCIIYELQGTDIQMNQNIDLGTTTLGAYAVPHSVGILCSPRIPDMPFYFLLGIRQGSILSFRLHYTTHRLTLSDEPPSIYTLGSLAVSLTVCLAKDTIYALSNQLWQLRCNSSNVIETEQVLLQGFDRAPDAVAFFNWGIETKDETLALVADDRLHLFQLSPNSRLNFHNVELGQTPRKIIYNESLNYVIALTSTIMSGTRKNYMHLINPKSGHFLTESQRVGRDNNYAKNDMILSAAEWCVVYKSKQYQYLCVGFGHPKESLHTLRNGSLRSPETSIERGTLVLYRLKAYAKRGSVLKRIWINERLPGGVLSICPYSAGLLFSAGNRLYLYRFDSESGRLAEIAHIALPNVIKSIHENKGHICITSQSDSVSFYKFNEDKKGFELLASDINAMSIHHLLMLNYHTVVGVSYSGGMVALNGNFDEENASKRLESLFSFHFSDIMVKPTLAALKPLNNVPKDMNFLLNNVIPWDTSENDLQELKPIVCCTVSGSILHIYRISSQLYRVLNTLQELLLIFEPTLPLLGATSDFQDWYCQLSSRQKATIHGDLVESYLRLSFDEQLSVLRPGGSLSSELAAAANDLLIGSDDTAVDLESEQEDNKTRIIAYLLISLLSEFSRYC
ncbi:hypothetical protein G6F70_003534 [Rhizopus microsporus]|nr:hypothetical protein G6F71_003529 [Rhizopus microsporus]KAG1201038.1 hypothetical protein G6F70_003534 [Rhizopus microsporus]KAG1212866.1 hypothetical protein G6F69_003306 [Rhizopus microsporus]KAG1234846.1 hypothetical protein G6F67_003200 [Rhizopus microsporus]KAG1267088.1 hypothetical protein G6F68_002201 [Rhizopus microsporus]